MPFRYLMGLPLGSWIIRKAIEPSVDTAGKSFTGMRTRERRRLPDQRAMGAMRPRENWRPNGLRIWVSDPVPQVNKAGLEDRN
jgi:hypothetical protein